MKYDPAPLLELAEARCAAGGRPEWTSGRFRGAFSPPAPVSVGELACLLGCSPRTVTRWRAAGRLCAFDADRYAVRLGLHPCLIWPDWFTDEGEKVSA